jgi:hypothetical protein
VVIIVCLIQAPAFRARLARLVRRRPPTPPVSEAAPSDVQKVEVAP